MDKQIDAVVAAYNNLRRAENALYESSAWARKRALEHKMIAELADREREELDVLLQALRTSHAEWENAYSALRYAAQRSAEIRRALLLENPPLAARGG
jgi:hypothetical protein